MPQLIASVQGVEVKRIYLTRDRTSLGRKPGNEIVLDNLAVSGSHCVFQLRGLADVFVEDLGSTNGTFVNNQRVKQQQQLHDEDVIAVGNFRLRFLSASGESGYHETRAMPLEALGQLSPAVHAGFELLNGSSAGLKVPVVKAVTTFGKPGAVVVAVSHRRNGYYALHMEGAPPPTVNGAALGADPLLLADDDVLEVGGTSMRFRLQEG